MNPLPAEFDLLARVGEAAWAGYWMPQLVWAGFAGLVLLILRYLPLPRPILGYQLLTALLLALPAGLLLAPVIGFEVTSPWVWPVSAAPGTNGIEVGLPTAEVNPVPTAWTALHALGLITLLTLLLVGAQLMALGFRMYYLHRLRSTLAVPAPAEARLLLESLRQRWHVRPEVALFVSPEEHSPVTFGWMRPAVVLPISLLDDRDALEMTLEHELIHVAHGDYARGVVESLIRAVFFLNPVVHGVVQRIERFRELACDAELLHRPDFSRKRYANLLARFAFQPAPDQRLAVHMSSAGRLKERVQALSTYRAGAMDPRSARTLSGMIAGVFFTLGILAMGCEVTFDESLTVNQYSMATPEASTPPEEVPPNESALRGDEVFMIVEQMPVLVGGLRALQDAIVYPDEARKAGIEGRVFIQFVVDTQGRVVDPVVVRGIGGGCDEEALRAVSEARFAPGRQRGIPVAVKMSVPITFKLEDPAS